MSAAATAAGYLYASGRLRGRNAKDHGEEERPQEKKTAPRNPIRVAVLPEEERVEEKQPAAPRRVPKIEYRTRKRWTAA